MSEILSSSKDTSHIGFRVLPHSSVTAAAAAKSLQSCPTVQPHRRQPTRLPHPWDSPGFPNSSVGKESGCNPGDLGFDPWVGKIRWRKKWLPTPVFWPGEFHGLYSPWGCKESDMTEQPSSFFFFSPSKTSSHIITYAESSFLSKGPF